MRLLLETGILGQLCHPNQRVNRPVCDWLSQRLARATRDDEVCVPEIAFYELRRKLVHLLRKGQETTRSLERLDRLCDHLVFLPITREIFAPRQCFGRTRGSPDFPRPMIKPRTET